MHDFALPAGPGLRKVLPDDVALSRSFYLIRHADDRRLGRLNTFAQALHQGVRRELTRLEGMT